MRRGFAFAVAATMVLGVLAGIVANHNLDSGQLKSLASGLSIVTDLFLRLIRMIIAPLVRRCFVAVADHGGAAGASVSPRCRPKPDAARGRTRRHHGGAIQPQGV